MKSLRKSKENSTKRLPPGKTIEAREDQMIALSVELAEKQLREGKASSQVIIHYLKLGSTKERLEKEKIINENELLKAKVEALASQKEVAKLYAEALDAMRLYSGRALEESTDEDSNL